MVVPYARYFVCAKRLYCGRYSAPSDIRHATVLSTTRRSGVVWYARIRYQLCDGSVDVIHECRLHAIGLPLRDGRFDVAP